MAIETDQAPEDLQLALLATLNDRYKIDHLNVNAASDDSSPLVQFVVCPTRGLLRAFVDDLDAAEDLAKKEGAVLVDWAADSDYRGEVTV
jgi:hypothetical protein